jgi:hypothetical protein
MNQRLSDTLGGSFNKLISALQKFGVAYGTYFAPAVKGITQAYTTAIVVATDGLGAGLDQIAKESFESRTKSAQKKMDDFKKSVADAAEKTRQLQENFKFTYDNVALVEIAMKKVAGLAGSWKNSTDTHQGFFQKQAGGEDFQGALKRIHDQYQDMMVGEERMARVRLESLLLSTDLSKEDRARGEEALRQLDSIAFKKKFDSDKEAEDIEKQRVEKERARAEEEKARLIADAPDEARRQVEEEMRDNKFGAVSAQRGSVEAYRLMIAAANENRKRDVMAEKIGKRTNQLLEEIKNKPAAVLAKAGR